MGDVKKICDLQDIAATISCLGIRMPQIVAIGSQSSGKSSVLDQIVRREILPRGTNLVTRCPVVLHLRRCFKEAESVVFDHLPGSVHDFALVGPLIAERMLEICGNNKGISDTPITAFVNLKDTLEMTLVDLPGLIKVPIGDQPEDIEVQVERMALEYAMRESSIILALVNANADIATNEALKIARKADPGLKRTLGVVTKIDLMDKGTDCMEVLCNRYPRLSLGYVGVINRGQHDIVKGISVSESILKETRYFKESPVYKRLYPNIGSNYLVKRLNEVFYRMVADTVPGIKMAVRNQLCDKTKRLHEIGASAAVEDERTLLLSYHQTVVGIFKHVSLPDQVFARRCSSFLSEAKDVLEKECFSAEFEGLHSRLKRSSYLFISEAVFHDLVRENIRKMTDVYLQKANTVARLLADEICAISSTRFERLARRLNGVVCECIEVQRSKLVDSINTYSAIQSSYVNVDHPDFDKTKALGLILRRAPRAESGLLGMFNGPREVSFDDRAFEAKLITELVTSYLAIVGKEMKNYVVKAIHYHLCEYIDGKLLRIITGLQLEDSVLVECPEVTSERDSLARDIGRLESALATLNSF